MTPSAYIAHSMEGRLRLRIPDLRGQTTQLSAIEEKLESLDEIFSVRSNPNTGSVVIEHNDLSVDQLDSWGREQALFELETTLPPNPPPSTLAQWAQHGLGRLDTSLKQNTQGILDFKSSLLVVLLLLMIRQIKAGQLMVPGLALLWYALELVGFDRDSSDKTKTP